MIKRNSSYEMRVSENMRGGAGTVKIEHLLSPDELNNKGRLFAKITLEPGTSIGSHVHEGEMESYYIVSGKAEYDDAGETITLYPGDTTHTPVGGEHAIMNAGSETLVFIALILFE
jgi:mannose-6-phosphate isomerase-like protein (cupin superfamily)